MKLHRFYVDDMVLEQDFWMQDKGLFHQLTRVLRFQVDRELVLFNDQKTEKLYKIIKIGNNAIHLQMLAEMDPKVPEKDLYLCFSLLKKDKNDWILQKGTELGVRHFVPLLSGRTEKTGFNIERAEKIAIEASEQCGRTDIPRVREPITVETLINELKDKTEILVAEQGSTDLTGIKSKSLAILVGPEGGWTDQEKQLFKDNNLKHIGLSEFTLRAETAAITAASLLQ